MCNTRLFTLLPLLLLVFGLKLTAQTDTPYERKIEGAVFDSYDFRGNHVVGYDTNGAFCYQNIKDMPQLVHISHQLATIKTYDIPLTLTNAGREYEFIDWISPVLLGDKICFFYKSVYSKGSVKLRLIHTISISDFTPLGKVVEINTENAQSALFVLEFWRKGNIESSPDHSQLLHYYELDGAKPEETKIDIFRHNNQIDKYTESIFSLPFASGINPIEQAVIDNSGNAYFLIKERFDKARTKYAQKNNLPPYQYYVYFLPKGSAVPIKKEVNIPGKFIASATISIAYNNDLICSGYYSSKGNANGFIGANAGFYIRYDAEKHDVVSQTENPFGDEFITTNKISVFESKEVEFAELNIREVINQPDGTSILFSEFDNGVLLVIAYSMKGELLWKNCIHTQTNWQSAILVTEKSIHVLCSALNNYGQSLSRYSVELNHYVVNIKSGATKRTILDSNPEQLSILGGSSGLMSSNELLVHAKHRSLNVHTRQYLLFDFSNK